MSTQQPNEAGPQLVETKQKKKGRNKRISQILPQLRNQIPALFDRGIPAERLAEDFDLNKTEILEHLIRDTRNVFLRGPGAVRVMAAGASLRVVAGRAA